MKLGFIGLGQMGRGMADRLLEAGHELVVYNRSRAVAESFHAKGASVAGAPGELMDAEIVITMLADDAATEAVWVASGLAAATPPAVIHLNMATIGPRMAQRVTALHHTGGSEYVAAPVFGRPEFAARGQLDIVAAGSTVAIERCKPVFAVLGRQFFVVGSEPYQANVVKVARNFMLATIVESLGEGLALVRKWGVDAGTFLDLITTTSMNAPAYKSYGRMMVERRFEPGFSLKLGLKDVELALQVGAEGGVPLPLGELLREQHLAAIAHGYGEQDWAALGEYIARNAGLE